MFGIARRASGPRRPNARRVRDASRRRRSALPRWARVGLLLRFAQEVRSIPCPVAHHGAERIRTDGQGRGLEFASRISLLGRRRLNGVAL